MSRIFTLRSYTWAVLPLAVLAGMIVWKIVYWTASSPRESPPDPIKARAWDKVVAHLRHAEAEGAQATKEPLLGIEAFFAERQAHAGAFADDVLSLGGKWAFIQGKLPWIGDEGKAHQAYLRAAFERHLFKGEDLQAVVQAAVTAYLSVLEGQENALLVAIRADLSAEQLPGLSGLAALCSDEAFQAQYRKLLADVIPVVSRDLKITLGREAAVFVGTDLAAGITIRIASALAVRLGISGGILGTGAASGTVTLGVGLLAGFLVDGVVDWIMRRCGYDPAGAIARHTSSALDHIRQSLTEGDPEAKRVYQKLRRLQEEDPIPFVREECRQAAERVSTGGALGLRHELQRLRQLRERLRDAALRKLVWEGGAS